MKKQKSIIVDGNNSNRELNVLLEDNWKVVMTNTCNDGVLVILEKDKK